MASLIFKDVGQGDSLILEWTVGDDVHIGLIDCAKKGSKNPVLEYIIENEYTIIDFMILSHPHRDHYSGFVELLQYCFLNKISIGWFGHTVAQGLNKDYWKLFDLGYNSAKQFERVLLETIKLKKAGLLGDIESILKSWHKQLAPDVTLDALSPSHDEYESYQQKVRLEPGINIVAASQAANLLSTVIKISINDKHLLITSDAVTDTFIRLHQKAGLADTGFSLVQIPHHGSRDNHYDIFWQHLLPIDGRKAIVSAGRNITYKHPHRDVLQKIKDLKFFIHSTNIVHGMKELLDEEKVSLGLDMVSDLLDRNNGDKAFEYK